MLGRRHVLVGRFRHRPRQLFDGVHRVIPRVPFPRYVVAGRDFLKMLPLFLDQQRFFPLIQRPPVLLTPMCKLDLTFQY